MNFSKDLDKELGSDTFRPTTQEDNSELNLEHLNFATQNSGQQQMDKIEAKQNF